jgi:hypothetical protein
MLVVAGGKSDFETSEVEELCACFHEMKLSHEFILQAGDFDYAEIETQIERCDTFLFLVGAELDSSTWLNVCLLYTYKIAQFRATQRPRILGLKLAGWQVPNCAINLVRSTKIFASVDDLRANFGMISGAVEIPRPEPHESEIRIERSSKISLEEWKAAVSEVSGVKLCTNDLTSDGKAVVKDIPIPSRDGDAEICLPSEHEGICVYWERGKAWLSNSDISTHGVYAIVSKLAHALGARVVDCYEDDYRPFLKTKERKSWWRFW